jgi:hypothetical protein
MTANHNYHGDTKNLSNFLNITYTNMKSKDDLAESVHFDLDRLFANILSIRLHSSSFHFGF